MNSTQSSRGTLNSASPVRLEDRKVIKAIVFLSRIVTAIFLAALLWAIFQAVVNDNPLSVWAWLGIVTLLGAAVGLGMAAVVYRGVQQQAGPFDFRPSGHVTGALVFENRRVAAGGAAALRAEINMTQGVLSLRGGATDVMEADFTYDDADWRQPEVAYAVDEAGLGVLTLKQPATHRPAMHQGRAEWAIRLNRLLPTDLSVRLGAGKADLRLSGIALQRLRVEGGVGVLAVDLSGDWQDNVEVFVKAGIGDTLLRLPQNVGVRVQPSMGLGSLQVSDLLWDGAAYTNALYGQAAVALDVTVEGGLGKVELVLAD